MTLDEIALGYDTDKSSKFHNYTEKYARYFEGMRDKKFKLLEIGIQNGYSLKTWRDYFPNAEIYGIDIVDCSHMDEPRVKTIVGSQNDLAFLKKVNDQYGPFDIIIDDASHNSDDMKITLDFMVPLLKQDGIYVVEDIHCVYWTELADGGTSFMDRLKELLDMVNSSGKCSLADMKNAERDQASASRKVADMTWWERSIEYLHLYRSIVFIKKYADAPEYTNPPVRKLSLMVRGKRFISKVYGRLWHAIYRSRKLLSYVTHITRAIFLRIDRTVNRLLSIVISAIRNSLQNEAVLRAEIATYRKKIKIYDIFVFFNELELLEMRLNILGPHVDHFVIVEAPKTFSGLPKPLYYQDNKERFAKWHNKIIHVIVDDVPDSEAELRERLKKPNLSTADRELIEFALSSPNIPKGQSHWLRDFYQKEAARRALTGLADTDICYVSDLDEIWNPDVLIDYRSDAVFKLKQKLYMYYLNNRSSQYWDPAYMTQYKNLKHECINHFRSNMKASYRYVSNGGWHFTNMGGLERLKEKVVSWGHQEFNTPEMLANIDKHMAENKDFIGRRYRLWKDEADLPRYVLEHKEKYAKLFV